MNDNIDLEENTSGIIKKKKKKNMDDKVRDLLVEQMEKSQVKRPFEKMTNLLRVTKHQYLAIQKFEKFYKSRKNQGLKQMDKN